MSGRQHRETEMARQHQSQRARRRAAPLLRSPKRSTKCVDPQFGHHQDQRAPPLLRDRARRRHRTGQSPVRTGREAALRHRRDAAVRLRERAEAARPRIPPLPVHRLPRRAGLAGLCRAVHLRARPPDARRGRRHDLQGRHGAALADPPDIGTTARLRRTRLRGRGGRERPPAHAVTASVQQSGRGQARRPGARRLRGHQAADGSTPWCPPPSLPPCSTSGRRRRSASAGSTRTTAPLRLLCDVLLELSTVRNAMCRRQPIDLQERLCRMAAQLVRAQRHDHDQPG